jgi:hypothetical protein
MTADLAANKPIMAAGRAWSVETVGPLLQKDRLHPTFAGTVAVFAMALEALDRLTADAALRNFELDPAVLRERVVRQIQAGAAAPATTAAAAATAATTASPAPAGASAGSDPSPAGSPAAAPTGHAPRR